MRQRIGRGIGRGWLGLAWLALLPLIGCSGNDLSTDPLAAEFTRAQTAIDGFVFVPNRSRTRQTAAGQTLPNALIRVYILPREAGEEPVRVGQADSNGEYRIVGLPLNAPLLIEATEPFPPAGQAARTLSGIVSFTDEDEEKNDRHLTDTSTVAAQLAERQGSDLPFSDAQVEQLQQLAEQALSGLPAGSDITTNGSLLTSLVDQLQSQAFGSLLIRLFSNPAVSVTLRVNGQALAPITTLVPPSGGLTGGSEPTGAVNERLVSNLPIGTAQIAISAPGFGQQEFATVIVGGTTTLFRRILVPAPVAGANGPPVVQDAIVRPSSLPFTGGRISIEAIITDPNGDSLDVEAVVAKTTGGTAARQEDGDGVPGEVLTTVALERGTDGIFRGVADIPGNPESILRTYLVRIDARDPQEAEASEILFFTVAGTSAPPDPPSPDQNGSTPE